MAKGIALAYGSPPPPPPPPPPAPDPPAPPGGRRGAPARRREDAERPQRGELRNLGGPLGRAVAQHLGHAEERKEVLLAHRPLEPSNALEQRALALAGKDAALVGEGAAGAPLRDSGPNLGHEPRGRAQEVPVAVREQPQAVGGPGDAPAKHNQGRKPPGP